MLIYTCIHIYNVFVGKLCVTRRNSKRQKNFIPWKLLESFCYNICK